MCLGSLFSPPSAPAMPAPIVMQSPAAPPPPSPPPAAPAQTREVVREVQKDTPVPQTQDREVQESRLKERRRRLRASGDNTTLVTGGQGLVSQASTGNKQLFGS